MRLDLALPPYYSISFKSVLGQRAGRASLEQKTMLSSLRTFCDIRGLQKQPRGCAVAYIRGRPFIRHVDRLRALATCSGARTRRAPGACDGGRPRTMTSRSPPFAKLPSRRRRRVRRGCWQRAIQTRARRPALQPPAQSTS